VKRRRAAET